MASGVRNAGVAIYLLSLTASALCAVAPASPPNCEFEPTCRPGESHRLAIPCEGKCSSYYQCVDGVPTEKKCGKFFWHQNEFDATTLDCVREADCNWWRTTTTSTTTPTPTTMTPSTPETTSTTEATSTSTTETPSSTTMNPEPTPSTPSASTTTDPTTPTVPAAPTTPTTPPPSGSKAAPAIAAVPALLACTLALLL